MSSLQHYRTSLTFLLFEYWTYFVIFFCVILWTNDSEHLQQKRVSCYMEIVAKQRHIDARKMKSSAFNGGSFPNSHINAFTFWTVCRWDAESDVLSLHFLLTETTNVAQKLHKILWFEVTSFNATFHSGSATSRGFCLCFMGTSSLTFDLFCGCKSICCPGTLCSWWELPR